MRRKTRPFAAVLLCTLPLMATMSKAQVPPPAANATSQAGNPAAPAIAPGPLHDAALRVAQAIDSNLGGQLWDSASWVAKRAVSQESFVTYIAQARTPLGVAALRNWTSIELQRSDGSAASPAGEYASVRFETSFTKGGTRQELISFRRDEDGVWRFTGYVVR
jgi:hypothetical protein